ncbi:AAEL017559-PA [Aedes aegypti]|uniref:AAEL017559-PA n=1 Tax=Aedes aegypti TaxID=7159 RepID=J9HGV5_AEDAE|nr:AAEL017559-PA [Aedes aegypti]
MLTVSPSVCEMLASELLTNRWRCFFLATLGNLEPKSVYPCIF